MGAPIEAVAVVVPVRDEEERLARCLRGLARTVTQLADSVAVQVVLVLDGCTDGSAGIAARWPFTVVETAPQGVGRARALGVETALAALPGFAPERVWIASTDADSEVPWHWLPRQLAVADDADVVLGTVRPDPHDLPAELRHTPIAHAATAGEPVYGANLGVRADWYRQVGGFEAVREHEDVRLVAALRAAGARVTADYDIAVLTAGRLAGRAPGGYAGYLRQEAALARAVIPTAHHPGVTVQALG